MEVCSEDSAVSGEDVAHCLICQDSLTLASLVRANCGVASVHPPYLWDNDGDDVISTNWTAKQQCKNTVSVSADSVASQDGDEPVRCSRTIRTALSAILEPLGQSVLVSQGAQDEVVCRPCGRLVSRVDMLRTWADRLQARLLARLGGRQAGAPETAPRPVRAVRGARVVRVVRARPLPPVQESQNYIAPPPPSSPAVELGHAAAQSAVISIEICRADGETSGAATGRDLSESDDGAAADTAPSPASSPPPPPPPPEDPPPTYVRHDQSSQCGVCQRHFDTRAACRQHMRAHQAKKVYFCPLCPAALMARNALWTHEQTRHADSPLRPYGCGQCGDAFPTPRFLQRHKEAAHRVLLPCAHCRRTFRRSEDLDAHQMVHTGQRPYQCNRCGKSFTKQPVWRQHVRTHSRRPRPHQCGQCPRAFLSALHLAVHARRHRAADQPLACSQCDRSFTSENRLRRHALKHSAAHLHTCSVCGKSFTKRSLLADHTRTHTGEKPFICEHCGTGFAQRSNLTAHKSAVHLNERPFECSVCKKAFKRKPLLTYHYRTVHTDARPARCTLCPAAFASTQQLRAHQKTHGGGGAAAFGCGVCGRSFSSQSRCQAHLVAAHSDRRPFQCRECGSEFPRRAQLLAHAQELGHGAASQAELRSSPGGKAAESNDGQLVVRTMGDDVSAIYGQVELTVTTSQPPGAPAVDGPG